MGFRSTFVTSSGGPILPNWFREKWQHAVFFREDSAFPFSSQHEAKLSSWSYLLNDLQQLLRDVDFQGDVELVFLHECAGISRVYLTQKTLVFTDPEGWCNVENPYGENHFNGDLCLTSARGKA